MKVALSALLLLTLSVGCTGGQESNAAEEAAPSREAPASQNAQVNPQQTIGAINPSIPIYHGALYRDDLTRRDEVMIKSRYGADAQVYTLATDDSFPQVYHYYTTYLAQFRGFPSQDTYPSERKQWRTLEVQLNQAMQDPFIPGKQLDPNGQQVTLQIAETEAEPKTVIRYIVTPRPASPPAVATAPAVSQPGNPETVVAR